MPQLVTRIYLCINVTENINASKNKNCKNLKWSLVLKCFLYKKYVS